MLPDQSERPSRIRLHISLPHAAGLGFSGGFDAGRTELAVGRKIRRSGPFELVPFFDGFLPPISKPPS